MLSEQQEKQQVQEEPETSSTTQLLVGEEETAVSEEELNHKLQDLVATMNKGPEQMLNIESNMKNNSAVMQQHVADITQRVNDLENGLFKIMEQVQQMAEELNVPLESEIHIEPMDQSN